MDVITTYNKLKEHPEVQEILKDSNYFLTHACLIEEPKVSSWEYGFYNSNTQKITVFESLPFKVRAEDDVLKKDETPIKKLHIDSLKISFEDAMQIADLEVLKKGITMVNKKIIILKQEDIMLWNITMMTQAFNLINIKISAETGDVLNIESYSIYDLGLKRAL